MRVYLIGFMGSGKSTLGALLAARLGYPFLDTDDLIADCYGASVFQIFEEAGETTFRSLETTALRQTERYEDVIVACGGGIVLRNENRELLAQLGIVCNLTINADEALARIGDAATRPMLSGMFPDNSVASLLSAREKMYSAVADFEVDTVGKTPDELVESLSRLLAERSQE